MRRTRPPYAAVYGLPAACRAHVERRSQFQATQYLTPERRRGAKARRRPRSAIAEQRPVARRGRAPDGAGLPAAGALSARSAGASALPCAARRRPARSRRPRGRSGSSALIGISRAAPRPRRARRRRAATACGSREIARARPAQRLEMRAAAEPLAEIVRERPHVEARLSRRRARVASPSSYRSSSRARWTVTCDRLQLDGLSAPRQLVGRRAADLLRGEGGRRLEDTCRGTRPSAASTCADVERRSGRRRRLARSSAHRRFRVVGGGRAAEPDAGVVLLLVAARGTARAASRGRRTSGSTPVASGSSVPVWPMRVMPMRPPHPRHDVVRRRARAACRRRARRSWLPATASASPCADGARRCARTDRRASTPCERPVRR